MNHPDDLLRQRRPMPWRQPLRRAARWTAAWPDLLTDVLSFAGALACAALAAVVLAVLGGCGGGVGTEGTGSFASGPITGYGSIIVNGIHFDESAASVQDDDAQALDRSALALGMVVQVTGSTLATDGSGRSTATASQIRAVRALLGQVSARDLAAGTLTVLDQTVMIQADTVIDTALGGSLAGTVPGSVVEVYGSFDATLNAWRASRVAAAPAGKAGRFSLRGTVGAVDADAGTVVVNGRTYSTAGLGSTAALQVGALLKLDLASAPDNQGRWVCSGDSDGQPSLPGDRDNAQARGLITRLASASRWVVDGTPVDVSGAKVQGTPALGARAEVNGVLRGGVLVASSVKVSSLGGDGGDARFEIEGTPSALDTLRQRFVVRGTTISYARSDVVYQNGASPAALVGYTGKLKVAGVLSSDRSVVEATLIRFEP